MSIKEKERFSGVFSFATQLARELKLEYYTSDPKRLTLQEALYLVAQKKQLPNTAIPTALSEFPWKIPNTCDITNSLSDEKVKKINGVLEHSMKIQMGTIPGTEFDKHILSNACLAISGLLHVYFNALRIHSDIGKKMVSKTL